MSDNIEQMKILFPEVAEELHRLQKVEKKYISRRETQAYSLLDVSQRVGTYDAILNTVFNLYRLLDEEQITFAIFSQEMFDLKETWKIERERY